MYATNDYLAGLLIADRQHELQAEVAENHLGKVATAGRPSWWRRLTHRSPQRAQHGGLKLHHAH